MASRRGRPRRIDPDIDRRIRELAQEPQRYNAAEIQRRLLDDPRFKPLTPQLRTIQKIVRDVRPQKPDRWWSSADPGVTPADAALVLPVIGELIRREVQRVDAVERRRGVRRPLPGTGSGYRIAADLARWIVHVRTIAPDMRLYDAYQMATRYAMAATSGASVAKLDAYMGLGLWRDPLLERGAIVNELIPPNWWHVGPSIPKEEQP